MGQLTTLITVLFLATSPAFATTATPAPGAGAPAGTTGGGIGDYWWIILVVIIVIAALLYFRGRGRGGV